MPMNNSSELANALNPNISQDHRAAYAQHYSPNYAQSFSVAHNLLHQHDQQVQQEQQEDLFSVADTSARVQYAQSQYPEHQQQDSQSELQNTPTLLPHEDVYSHPTQQHVYNIQQVQQAFPASQGQLQPQPPQEQQHLRFHDQQQYHDAPQTQPHSSANLLGSYPTNTPKIPNRYAPTFGDPQSSGYTATSNYSTLADYNTPTTSYAAPTTTPITQNAQTTPQYPQYPSPRSAHTTPHVQHHQVSVREVPNAPPAASSSLLADMSQHDAYGEAHAPPTVVETPAITHSHVTNTRDSSHEQVPCEFANMLPTPALEPRRKTPAVQPLVQKPSQQQSTGQHSGPSHTNESSSAVAAPSVPVSKQAPASSQRHQHQQPQPPTSRATERMVQALPLFMMETFKVIRKEKDLNEEDRKRRAAWEEAHEERQSRTEAELAAQQKKLDAMEERLARREEEQAKREEELARKDEELAKKDEEIAKEKEDVRERLKGVEIKMAEMRAMIEAVRAVASTTAPPASTPIPVVAQSLIPVVPTVTSSVPIMPMPIADQRSSEPSSLRDNEETFMDHSPQHDSPEPFDMSPDLDAVHEEPDLPPVSSISVPTSQEGSQSVASTSSSQPSHSNTAAPPMYHFPMPPLHAHNYGPAPGTYHFPTPYYPYHPGIPPNYNIQRPALPAHTGSMSQLSDFNNQSAAAQYITPNLTPDLAPATVVRAPPPQELLPQEVMALAQRKRKSKAKHQKQKKKKRKKRAADDGSDEEEDTESEFASEDEDSSSAESDAEVEPRRRPKRANGHDKKIYTLPHALRAHIYSMMEIISDKELPDSHDESTVYHPSQPVRFVWEKTCKQSVHNARMKLLILEDIKEKRARLYPKVPVEDFSVKAMMEKKFDNVFETMRGKYKAQRSEELAQKEREREAKKARNSRHSARKAAKLSDRSETRLKMPKYEPVVFDPALLRECMSSDESDVESDPTTQTKADIYRSRGPGWRSGRLVKFYKVLEDNKVVDPNVRPKGGIGKKRPRRTGPPKDEFCLPPKGVAPWMVSRRWVEKARKTHVDLDSVLGKLIANEYVLDGEMYEELGDESEVGEDGEVQVEMEMHAPPAQDQQETSDVPTQAAQMRTLSLGLQPQQLEVGPAFRGRYTL